MYGALAKGLRARGVMILTALEAKLIAKPDDEHLAFATQLELVLFSHNITHFCRIHAEWLMDGREHAGIILGPQQRFSIGEELRRILRIRATSTAEDMRNRIEFLTQWP